MDTDTLVEARIDDGLRLIDRLIHDHFDVAVACWVKTTEDADWFLYIASRKVDDDGLAAAYRDVYRVIQSMPDIVDLKSKIKLVGANNPIAHDVREIQERHGRRSSTRYPGPRLGALSIDEAYVYPRFDLQEPANPTAQGVTFANASEIEVLLGEAVRNTAARLGIRDALFFSVDELGKQIELKDSQTSALLKGFIDAYWKWFDFHRRVESLGKQGLLDADEHEQLARLVAQRNQTRQALLGHLHGLS